MYILLRLSQLAPLPLTLQLPFKKKKQPSLSPFNSRPSRGTHRECVARTLLSVAIAAATACARVPRYLHVGLVNSCLITRYVIGKPCSIVYSIGSLGTCIYTHKHVSGFRV